MTYVIGTMMTPFPLSSQEIQLPDNKPTATPLVLRSETYDRESIWNFHTSDADLYLEYGFRSLLVKEYRVAERIFREEVYDLASPLDAFGILTCNRMALDLMDSTYPGVVTDSFECRMAAGDRYMVLTVLAGSGPGRDSMAYLANRLMPARDTDEFTLPEPFDQPIFQRVRNNLVYIRGQAGLRNSNLPWQELMLGLQYDMFAISMPVNGSDLLFARITFSESPLIMIFLEKAGLTVNTVAVPNTNTADGLYREFQQVDDTTIYFLECQEPFPIDVLVNAER